MSDGSARGRRVSWRSVEAAVRAYIRERRPAPGDALPSDSHFADLTGASRLTVRRAMAELAQRGVVVRGGSGSPTRIPEQRHAVQPSAPTGFAHTAETLGAKLENRIVELCVRPAHRSGVLSTFEAQALQVFGLRRAEPLMVVSRLRLLNGAPAALHRSYLDPRILPGDFLQRHDLQAGSLVQAMQDEGLTPVSRDTVLRAVHPLAGDAVLLDLPELTPILEAEQVLRGTTAATGDGIVPLEFLLAHYNIDFRIESRPW